MAVGLLGMFRCLRQARHWKQMQRNPFGIHSSDFILSHCPMVPKYFWHSLLILIIRRRNYAPLKSKIYVERRGNPLKTVFNGTVILWFLDLFHILLFNSFSKIHSSLSTDTAIDWFLARTALKDL